MEDSDSYLCQIAPEEGVPPLSRAFEVNVLPGEQGDENERPSRVNNEFKTRMRKKFEDAFRPDTRDILSMTSVSEEAMNAAALTFVAGATIAANLLAWPLALYFG